MDENKTSIIQLYQDDDLKTPISPLLDYQQIIPTKNKKYTTSDKKHIVSYGVGKYIVDSSTMRTLDYSNISAFKTQLQTKKYYPLSVLCDSQGYMYSVIPDGTFATENYVRTYVNNIALDGIVDLSDYATIKYVDDSIKNINTDPNGNKSLDALTIFVYCGSDISVPNKPEGGKWVKNDDNEIIITYPDGWGTLSEITTYPIYMSSSIQLENGKFITEWSEPVIVSGVDGKPGEDGKSIEFKYLRTKINERPQKPNETTEFEWTDDPTGISVQYPFEWISSRSFIGNESVSEWSVPVLWSRWGVDGKDGKDIEYIYIRNHGEIVENPTPVYPNEYAQSIFDDKEYQKDEFCPIPWTNDPQGIDKNDPETNTVFTHEWVSIRKKINGFWCEFSDPVSWAIKGDAGDSGISLRTLYAKFSNTISGSEISDLIVRDDINPGSVWSYIIPDINDDEWIWSISAYVTKNNELAIVKDNSNGDIIGWQGPILATGKGKDGEIGPNGISGTPGIDFVIKYCRGNIGDNPNTEGIEDNWLDVSDINDYDSDGWYDDVNDLYNNIDSDFPYIYCVQGRKTYERKNDNLNEFNEVINWGTPFRLSGTNGLNGKDGLAGKNGKIIYPAGVYNAFTTYKMDDTKVPYVLDTLDNRYYVLNCDEWLGQDNRGKQPSEAGDDYWVKFEQFEAIYADIGMLKSALVGSAVFNGDFMFSQQTVNGNSNYEDFCKDLNGELVKDSNGNLDPFNDNCIFKPSFCVNLKTGKTWLSNGNVIFNADGSGELAGGKIFWNNNGELILPAAFNITAKYNYDSYKINNIEYSIGINEYYIGNIEEATSIQLRFMNSSGIFIEDFTQNVTKLYKNKSVQSIIDVSSVNYDDLPVGMYLFVDNNIVKILELDIPKIDILTLNARIDDSLWPNGGWGRSYKKFILNIENSKKINDNYLINDLNGHKCVIDCIDDIYSVKEYNILCNDSTVNIDKVQHCNNSFYINSLNDDCEIIFTPIIDEDEIINSDKATFTAIKESVYKNILIFGPVKASAVDAKKCDCSIYKVDSSGIITDEIYGTHLNCSIYNIMDDMIYYKIKNIDSAIYETVIDSIISDGKIKAKITIKNDDDKILIEKEHKYLFNDL